MIQVAVFFLSLSALSFEVLLARIFAITQWNHLSFMVISLALFGFAASGTVLSLVEARKPGWQERFIQPDGIVVLVALYGASALAAFVILLKLPLDYFLLPLEPIQGLYLFLAYVVLALPFFFAGAAVSIAYSGFPEQIRFTYFATMGGSACGALLPFFLLHFFKEGQLVVLAAVVPLLFLFPMAGVPEVTGGRRGHRRRPGFIPFMCMIAVVASALLLWRHGGVMDILPSDYKSLSHALRFPDTQIDWSKGSLQGRIDRVRSPYIRFAPGLSLTFTGRLPSQTALFRDADNQTILYDRKATNGLDFARWTHAFAGYHLVNRPDHVLVIQTGGGLAMASAVASGAPNITVLEHRPHSARWIREHYDLNVKEQHARVFLAKTTQRFDVVHVEAWGPSMPGVGALDQSFLLTTEAITAYIEHLTDGGILVLSGRLRLPPADIVRLWAAAWQAITRAGVTDPGAHLAVVRNWDTFSLLATRKTPIDPESLTAFTQRLNFDLVYLKGLHPDLVNRYNMFKSPFHYDTLQQLASAYRGGTEDLFFSTYLLDVAPQGDDRPFPNRFLRWEHIGSIYRMFGSRLYTLLLSGEVVIAVVLIEAGTVAIFLMGVPLIIARRSSYKISGAGILYFLGIGAGFMLAEMYLIFKLVLVFGDPIISLTAVLAGLLVMSGLGGMLSRHFREGSIPLVLLLVTAVLGIAGAGMDWIFQGILAMPDGIRQAAVAVMVPMGLILGLPFPLGMQYLLESPLDRSYAWAANGCTSVIGSIAAAQLAISRGFLSILLAALAAYLVSLMAVLILRWQQWGANK